MSYQNEYENKCTEDCKAIAEQVNALADGQLYKVDGDYKPYLSFEEFETEPDEDGDTETKWRDDDGNVYDDEPETVSEQEYFDDVLDYEFVVNSDLSYNSVRVYVTMNGPTIWLDTETGCVELSAMSVRTRWGLSPDAKRMIDEYYEKVYGSLR